MKFKTEDVAAEFWRAEPLLAALAFYADRWVFRQFGHELFVTDVSRSQAEYDAIYPGAIQRGIYWTDQAGIKHYAGPMPHLEDPVRKLRCRAIDFGVLHGPHTQPERMKEDEARRLVTHLCASFPRRDGKPTAIYHDTGSGPHVHVQAEIWRA